jgi:protease I
MKLWRVGLIGVSVLMVAGGGFGKEPDVKILAGKKVVMIVAYRDFRDEEFFTPYSVLKDAGAEVIVASSHEGKARGMLGKVVDVNRLVGDVAVTNFDAVVFIGGSGAQEYFNNPIAHRLAQDAVFYKKVLGAICIAPETLANAGVLKGKKVTGFASIKPALGKAGALLQNQPVVCDGSLITADGPQSASGFGAAVVEALK